MYLAQPQVSRVSFYRRWKVFHHGKKLSRAFIRGGKFSPAVDSFCLWWKVLTGSERFQPQWQITTDGEMFSPAVDIPGGKRDREAFVDSKVSSQQLHICREVRSIDRLRRFVGAQKRQSTVHRRNQQKPHGHAYPQWIFRIKLTNIANIMFTMCHRILQHYISDILRSPSVQPWLTIFRFWRNFMVYMVYINELWSSSKTRKVCLQKPSYGPSINQKWVRVHFCRENKNCQASRACHIRTWCVWCLADSDNSFMDVKPSSWQGISVNNRLDCMNLSILTVMTRSVYFVFKSVYDYV